MTSVLVQLIIWSVYMHKKTSAQSLLSTCVLTLYYHHDNSGRNVPCDLFFPTTLCISQWFSIASKSFEHFEWDGAA